MKSKWKYIFIFIILILLNAVVFNAIFIEKDRYDEDYSKQWYLQNNVSNICIEPTMDEQGFCADKKCINSKINIGIEKFWEEKYDKELIIAIIDSKIDIYHEDLLGHIWNNKNEIENNGIDDDNNGYVDDYYGWNFCSNSNDVYSKKKEASHGTHCAGIIVADHNDIGIMGILGNTKVKIMTITVFNKENEEVDYKNIIKAISYAQKMGANICNISCVCTKGQEKIRDVINNSDMAFVVAAGNFNSGIISGLNLEKYQRYPACINLPNIITVGSIDENCKWSTFSNHSSKYVDICAPGEYIYSTLPNNKYGYESGTSMATPIVTSILGAYWNIENGNMSEAIEKLYKSARKKKELVKFVYKGAIVNFEQEE